MSARHKEPWLLLFAVGLTLFTLACALIPTRAPEQPPPTPTPTSKAPAQPVVETPTPTPTPQGGGVSPTPTLPPGPCSNLSGELEVKVLAGPAAAVGLEPFGVGTIPFSTTGTEPYHIQGAGSIVYEDTLVAEWGTYQVNMNLQLTLNGECVERAGGAQLDVTVDMSGDQMLEVNAEGFHGEYPWSGSHSMSLSFPLEDGVSAEGEGWGFVLHLQ